MKRSELRQLIREELKNTSPEGFNTKNQHFYIKNEGYFPQKGFGGGGDFMIGLSNGGGTKETLKIYLNDIEEFCEKLKEIKNSYKKEIQESKTISFPNLEFAIKKFKSGDDLYYDENKLKNIFNQLKSEDQIKARKKFPDIFIKSIKEQETEEDGMKSARSALLGTTKNLRIVIEGPDVKTNQKEIEALIKKNDPNNKVQFYEATGKFVGIFAQYKLDGLKRDLKKYNVIC